MLPQEILDMPYDEELIFIQGNNKTKPLNVKARKIKMVRRTRFQISWKYDAARNTFSQ
ncbi:hypothetical protein [Photorhabdus temperata]|uniref:hypothetical protein n=1 Tax=Photorhabdus temperata TaxID=574560 RepID=UPI003B75B7EF